MNTHRITSLADYLSIIEKLVRESLEEQFVFRGQAHKGNLVPGIARDHPKNSVEKLERTMLDEYSKIAASKLSIAENNALGLMISAQHFGMRTRLLDWSTNALTALWFACADRSKGSDTFVYALEADSSLMPPAEIIDPLKIAKTVLIKPRFLNARMIAQHGCFTLHFQRRDHVFVKLEANKNINKFLTEIHIPADYRDEILRALDRCGINSATLFPDLEGIGRYVNWKFDIPNRPNVF